MTKIYSDYLQKYLFPDFIYSLKHKKTSTRDKVEAFEYLIKTCYQSSVSLPTKPFLTASSILSIITFE